MVNGIIMVSKYLYLFWDNIFRDECLIYILYLLKKEKIISNLCYIGVFWWEI